ncbi:MAG: hypothetical protein WBW93_09905 [Steroidobacteraceae bacterium]
MRSQSRRFFASVLIAAVAGALLGCAAVNGGGHATSSAPTGRNAAPLPGKPACFRVADFGGSWAVLNDRELIVPDPVLSRWYLIELSAPVFDLKFKLRCHVIFEPFPPDVELICSSSSRSTDYLRVPHWGLGRVPILAVRELTAPERRQLLLQYHSKPPPGPPAKRDQGMHAADHQSL